VLDFAINLYVCSPSNRERLRLEPIGENPLRIIRSEAEDERAIAILDRLSDQGNSRS
jgi:hypothetical protein